ncbi:MAG: S1 RNA-binding domain-containing protein [Lachnospiraceae bacterium]|nr:S1 RNA-binding domain-containing protein [Lachnospiraceae bacterium]MDO4733813.1 S1 RNA-binding domain-containing protein [Lachnospiraceae bacterium]
MSEEFEAMGTELPEKETAAEETKAEEQEVKEPEVIESMDDFTEEIEASLQKIYPGDVMECTVVAVDETAVSVDLDYYAPGKIPPEEMSADPLFRVFTDVQIGDQFKAVVQQADDGAGNIILSKKEADKEFSWEKLEQMKEEETIIEGTVSGVTNSGAVFYVEGIRGFIPASKLDLKYVEDVNPYLGKKIRVQITEVDKERKKLILSAKELLVEAAAEEKLKKTKSLSVGSVLEGTVEKIMDYGAFVDIGNDLSGLLHISEISEKRIAHPKAVLKVGQKVHVTIIKVENGKISLSMKAAKEAEEEELNEEATEYKSEYVPNNPFAALLKDIKLDD